MLSCIVVYQQIRTESAIFLDLFLVLLAFFYQKVISNFNIISCHVSIPVQLQEIFPQFQPIYQLIKYYQALFISIQKIHLAHLIHIYILKILRNMIPHIFEVNQPITQVHIHNLIYLIEKTSFMNEADRKIVLQRIFAILDRNISKWSVIEVEQFLQIINCGQFQKLVRSFGINGQMLLENSKIQAIFVPQLKPSTILLFQKLLFILQELRPTQNQTSTHRLSRDTLSIPGNLMKTFRLRVDAMKQKNTVLWTTEDLITFLDMIGFSNFIRIIKQTSSDGIIMLYVVTDRRKLNRMSKSFEAKQLQEIVYVSQILLAQHYMSKEQISEDIEQIQLDPRQHSQIIFNMDLKKVASYQSISEAPEVQMLAQSMQSVYEQNDFYMTTETDNTSILEPIQNVQKHFLQQVDSDSSPPKNIYHRRNTEVPKTSRDDQDVKINNEVSQPNHVLSTSEYPISKSQFPQYIEAQSEYPLSTSQYPHEKSKTEQKSLDVSQYPEQKENSSEQANIRLSYPTSVLAESVAGSIRNDTISQNMRQSSNQLDTSQYNEEMSRPAQSVMAESEAANTIKNDMIYDSVVVNPVIFPLIIHNKQNIQDTNNKLAQFKQLKDVTLSMPFDLMTFENLNSIVLAEVRRTIHPSDQNRDGDAYISINNPQTYGVKGCRFGRDGTNDYSYPDEMAISGKHAIIFFKNKRFYLQDLKSKTGTFKLIDKIQIYDGLILQLAYEVQMVFQIISKKSHQGTIKVTFNRPTGMPNYQANIPNKMNCKIGRSPNSNIRIDQNNVSVGQKHAQIIYDDQKFFFRDLNSQNGSWLRLSDKGVQSQLLPLNVKDIIRISSKKTFQIESIHLFNLD